LKATVPSPGIYGLPDDEIWSIFFDRDVNLWIGTSKGLALRSKVDAPASLISRPQIRTFTEKDGLPAGRLIAIAQDRQGRLWFGTWGGGVSRYDGQTFQTFSTRDGLADNDVPAIIQDRDGRMWLGTSNGASSYAATEVVGSLSRFILALTFDPHAISYGA
jgi:ligand-binding sensor domain-containing protein